MTRYILEPDWITSRTDGQVHFVDVWQLRRLYRVPNNADVVCLMCQADADGFVCRSDDIRCYPRYDGQYPCFDQAKNLSTKSDQQH